MKEVSLGAAGVRVPAFAVGCMRLNGLEKEARKSFMSRAMAMGLYFFDHADIYGRGECETMFGEAVMEVDESGVPYWVCPRIVKRVGLFGGTDIQGGVNAGLRTVWFHPAGAAGVGASPAPSAFGTAPYSELNLSFQSSICLFPADFAD